MDWIFQLIELVAVVIIGTVVVVAIISLSEIISWFQARRNRIDNIENVARTVVDALDNGHYQIKYGIFNKRSASFIEDETKEAESLDAELKRKHAGRRIVDHII